MSVQFEENNQYNHFSEPTPKGITGWMIKKGIVSDETTAKKLMLGITVVCIILTIIVII